MPTPQQRRKRWTASSTRKAIFYVALPIGLIILLMWAAGRSTPKPYSPIAGCNAGSHVVTGYAADGSPNDSSGVVVLCGQEKAGYRLWAMYFDQKGPSFTRLAVEPIKVRTDGSFPLPAKPNGGRKLIYVLADNNASKAIINGPLTRTNLPPGARQLL